MSNQFKRLDDLKELAKDLPDGEKLELIKNELNKIETLLNEKLELVKERVPDIEKEVFKAPSVKEVQQVARESMDDDNLLNEALQLAKNQGVDVNTTPEQIKEYVQNPKLMEKVDEKVKTWYGTFLRGIYKKLKKDLKFIKDSQVFTPQGRPSGESDYTKERDKILRARAKELGYKANMDYGKAKPIMAQLVKETEGLNSIDSVKNILNRK